MAPGCWGGDICAETRASPPAPTSGPGFGDCSGGSAGCWAAQGGGDPAVPHRGEGSGCWQGKVPVPPALPQLIITLGNCASGRAGGPRGLACRCGASQRPRWPRTLQKAFNWNRVTARQPSNARDARNPLPASKGRFLYRLIKKGAAVGGDRCAPAPANTRPRKGGRGSELGVGVRGDAMEGGGRRAGTRRAQRLWGPVASLLPAAVPGSPCLVPTVLVQGGGCGQVTFIPTRGYPPACQLPRQRPGLGSSSMAHLLAGCNVNP